MSQTNSIRVLKKMKIVTRRVRLSLARRVVTTTRAKTTCILNLPPSSFRVQASPPPTKKLPKSKLCNQRPQICTTEFSNALQVQTLTLERRELRLPHAPNNSKTFQVLRGKRSLICRNLWTTKKQQAETTNIPKRVSRINRQSQ